jgi:hypothetical protein
VRTVGRALVVGWLLAALVLLGLDGRLLVFFAWTVPGSLLILAAGALVRQQLAPSMLDRPTLPERYRVADDLAQPLAAVVAAAEAEAFGRSCPARSVNESLAGEEPVPLGHSGFGKLEHVVLGASGLHVEAVRRGRRRGRR